MRGCPFPRRALFYFRLLFPRPPLLRFSWGEGVAARRLALFLDLPWSLAVHHQALAFRARLYHARVCK